MDTIRYLREVNAELLEALDLARQALRDVGYSDSRLVMKAIDAVIAKAKGTP